MEIGTLAIGAIVGFIAGALIFTSTGKSVTRAGAERVAYHVRPKKKRR